MQLEKLPLTPNGKIDRKALPAPDGKLSTGVAYAPPRNETEQVLAEIWQELLGAEQVGINDNFFDLGGHSLKALTLVTRIHKQLDIQIPLFEVFRTPILHQLAASIEALENRNLSPLNRPKRRSITRFRPRKSGCIFWM